MHACGVATGSMAKTGLLVQAGLTPQTILPPEQNKKAQTREVAAQSVRLCVIVLFLNNQQLDKL